VKEGGKGGGKLKRRGGRRERGGGRLGPRGEGSGAGRGGGGGEKWMGEGGR